MAKRDKASIYVDAQKLFAALYEAQFDMCKRDRPVMAVRLLDHTERIIANFAVAFESDNKLEFVNRMLAEFEIVKVELRFAIQQSIIRNPAHIKELTEIVVRLEEGIAKWRGYVISARQD